MSELTEERIREIVREEITAQGERQALAARTEIDAALAKLGRRRHAGRGPADPAAR